MIEKTFSSKNPYDLHNKIIKDINKLTGHAVPITIQTKNGKLVKIKIDSKTKTKEIKEYIEKL